MLNSVNFKSNLWYTSKQVDEVKIEGHTITTKAGVNGTLQTWVTLGQQDLWAQV